MRYEQWRSGAGNPFLLFSDCTIRADPQPTSVWCAACEHWQTGAAGFIGSTLVDHYQTGTASPASMPPQRPVGSTTCTPTTTRTSSSSSADIVDADLIRLLAEMRPEVVVPPRRSRSRGSVDDPQLDSTVNVVGTVRLAEAARRAGVCKVVHTSSGGSITAPAGSSDERGRRDDPASPYAASKVAGEVYLNTFRNPTT